MIKNDITPELLKQYSGEHLYYEFMMLIEVSELLYKEWDNRYLFNSLLESYIIHASLILDFFYKKQLKADDAKAVHFVKDKAEWKRKILPYHGFLKKFNTKRNKELVHLSYKRLDVTPESRSWQAKKVTLHIKELIGLFLDNCDPKLVDPKLFKISQKLFKNP